MGKSKRRYVGRAITAAGWRIWDNKLQRFWGEVYHPYPHSMQIIESWRASAATGRLIALATIGGYLPLANFRGLDFCVGLTRDPLRRIVPGGLRAPRSRTCSMVHNLWSGRASQDRCHVESAVRYSQAIVDMRAQPILNPRPQLGCILAQRGPANAAASRRAAVD